MKDEFAFVSIDQDDALPNNAVIIDLDDSVGSADFVMLDDQTEFSDFVTLDDDMTYSADFDDLTQFESGISDMDADISFIL